MFRENKIPGLIVAGIFALGISSCRRTPEPVPTGKLQQILDEVAPVDVWLGSPTPDASGSTLAYINGTEIGRRIVLLDLKTLEKRQIPTTNEVTFIFGWSPDDRYLAFAQIPPQPEKEHKTTPQFFESWLTLYDRQTGSMWRLTEDTNVMEVPFHWLPDGSYLMVSRNLTNDHGEFFIGNLGGAAREKVSDFVPDFAVMTDKMGVYAVGDLLTLELKPLKKTETGWDEKSKTVQKISDLRTNGFKGLVWVRYSPANSNFLFCARPAGSNWRYLYQYDPTSRELTQLSHEDTYNGQWLQEGSGFAYVINTNNSFQLAVRTKEKFGIKNLFTDGNVVVYKTSPQGDRLYVAASEGVEPHGIWEYTLTNQVLRKVAEGMNRPFVVSKVVRPREFRLKSFDGLDVPCFLFAPVGLETASEKSKPTLLNYFDSKKKYPAVIYVPPTSAQFQRKFDHQAQMFANLGFFYAAINYRGCDGYGADYSKLINPKEGARDVLELYEQLIQNPNVDANNVFLSTSSAGMNVVTELLAVKPELWRAVGLDKPGLCPIDNRFKPGKLPPMLMIMGDQDPALDSMKAFVGWAETNGLQVVSVLHTNAGHITYSGKDRRDTLQQFSRFFLRQLK